MLRASFPPTEDLQQGAYSLPGTYGAQSLKHLRARALMRLLMAWLIPWASANRCMPFENLLIDFSQRFMRHQVYLSTMDEVLKKNSKSKPLTHRPSTSCRLGRGYPEFDIPRIVSVLPRPAGVRWWTKAWFNGKEEGEPSVEIEERMAVQFIHCQVGQGRMVGGTLS